MPRFDKLDEVLVFSEPISYFWIH